MYAIGKTIHKKKYENVVAAGIRPIAKRFSMAGCVTVQGLSELLRLFHREDKRGMGNEEIVYQNKDITSKVLAENFKGKTFRV